MRKIVCAALLVFALATAALGQNYTMQTFAGGGLPLNIPAASASLGAVTGIAADASGNVYIALQSYSMIVRMDTAGALTLVAGNGTAGYSGDNGPATSAQLNGPWGIALDAAGNLYIADSGNNCIRKVTNGVITTVIGNAVGATLNYPTGVAVDFLGNLYIADSGDQVVLEVSGGSFGIIAGIPGSAGSFGEGGPATGAQLNFPWGVAVDGAGDVFIADSGNDAVREVSYGVINTLFYQQGTEPTSVALTAAGGLIFTAFGASFSVVAELTPAGTVSIVAGSGVLGYAGDGGPAPNAELNGPADIALDSTGSLYITDYYNNVVRKVSGGGTITTVAGSPQGFTGDNGAAIGALLLKPTYTATGPSGETYIVDSGHNVVRKVANGVITTVAGTGAVGYSGDNGPATSATLNAPWGVTVDSAGNLYISDAGNNVIRKVSSGTITTIAGNGTAGYTGDGAAATSATLNGPSGIVLDPAGSLYIADFTNHVVRRIAKGAITTFAGNGTAGYTGDGMAPTSATLSGPRDVKLDAAGNLYIADQTNNVIRIVSGGLIGTFAGNGTAAFTGDNGRATSAQLNGPSGVALDAAGNLIIADTGNNVIRKVSSGVITTLAGTGTANYSGDNGPAAAAAVNGPLGVSTNALGQIFVADSGNNLIRAMNPPCSFALTTSSIQATGAGGTFNIGVQTAAFCPWSVSGLPDWVTLGSPTSVSGPATVSLNVATATNSLRSATITVAGISVTVNQAACSYSLSPGAQEFSILGGAGTIAVTAPTGCAWSATNTLPFVTLTGATSGNGNGIVIFQVAANSGGVRSGNFTVAGLSFVVGQQSATITGLNFIGSMPHIAAQENWTTTFTLVNTSAASTQTRLSLIGDNGNALPLTLDFPQPPALNGLLASSIDNTIASNATLVVADFRTAGAAGANRVRATERHRSHCRLRHIPPDPRRAGSRGAARNTQCEFLSAGFRQHQRCGARSGPREHLHAGGHHPSSDSRQHRHPDRIWAATGARGRRPYRVRVIRPVPGNRE